MSRLTILCFVSCLLAAGVALSSAAEPSSTDLANKAKESAGTMTRRLYVTLRNIAFPEHPLTDRTKNLETRFLLLMPGKVLNYFDYFPGKEYTRFLQV